VTTGQDGPTFFLLSAQHGNEVNGSEAIRRFVRIAETNLLKGQVYAVPMTNLAAVRKRRPHISSGPEKPYGDDEGHNMNRTWPGNLEGNDTERIAYAIHEACAKEATHCLDLHSWSRFTATGCIFRRDWPASAEMARVSAIRFLHPRPDPQPPTTPCMIGALFNNTGRAAVTIELATQYTIVEYEVQRGVRAAVNLAKWLGVLPGEPEGLDEPQVDLDRANLVTIKAPRSGLFVDAALLQALGPGADFDLQRERASRRGGAGGPWLVHHQAIGWKPPASLVQQHEAALLLCHHGELHVCSGSEYDLPARRPEEVVGLRRFGG